MDPRSRLAELARDREDGAWEIARRARSALAQLAEADEPADTIEQDARGAVLDLLEAHPAMAPIVHLADETLQGLDERGARALADLPRPSPARRVADHAVAAILQAETVLTYSRSGTVLASLDAALEEGPLRVVTSEARPGREGLAVARHLAEAGADVELTYDAELFARVDEASLVLVGADAITSETFVNKAGTCILLERAREAGTPAHVLASTDKLWPAYLPRGPLADVEADWQPDVPATVEVSAPLFERVALELADRIVTEEGIHEPVDVASRVQGHRIHRDVVAVLER